MTNNIDKRNVPFLRKGMVMFVGGQRGVTQQLLWDSYRALTQRFIDVGYKFVFIPSIIGSLDKLLLLYLFPGMMGRPDPEQINARISQALDLGGRSGFLYRDAQDGEINFRPIYGQSYEELDQEVGEFTAYLSTRRPNVEKPKRRLLYRSTTRVLADLTENLFEEKLDSLSKPQEAEPIIEASVSYDIAPEPKSTAEYIPEPALDPRTEEIIRAWERMEREFGITLEDLDVILGYRIQLSRILISPNGRIVLEDWINCPDVHMDDMTKTIYFFYLRHPEGVALKRVQEYEEEILSIYLSLTGRDDMEDIRRSISRLIDPYENNLNVCLSRIKKAFKDIVGDRIAKYYYVTGESGKKRSIAINRDLVIWEHSEYN